MVRMLVIGYCFGIRSEGRLCEEVHLNLAYRWFCQLGLEDKVPDHSTFSKNRHGRFRESETFRHVFETVLRRYMNEGLVGGELRSLLDAWRDARRTAWQTAVKVVTTGILAALLVGVAIKLKLMGGPQ